MEVLLCGSDPAKVVPAVMCLDEQRERSSVEVEIENQFDIGRIAPSLIVEPINSR